MKKIALVTLVILAMLFSMLPISSAIAATVGTVKLFIKNQTGAPITITFTNAAGAKQQFILAAGTYFKAFPAYTYSYVANTACGTRYGSLNLTRRAQLYFSCKSGEEVVLSTIVYVAPVVAPVVADSCHLYGYLYSSAPSNYSPILNYFGLYNTWGCADGKDDITTQ